jgi:hypothetical protein
MKVKRGGVHVLRKLIKKLDALWALTVKEKAGWQCEHCGRYDSRMEAAHVVGRRHRATRWGFAGCDELPNGELCGHCLCHTCHQEYDEHGPMEHAILCRTIGFDRKIELQRIATQRVTRGQVFEEIELGLKKERAANDDSPYAND